MSFPNQDETIIKTITNTIRPNADKAQEKYTLDAPETSAEFATWAGENGDAILLSHAMRNIAVDFASKVRALRKGTDNNAAINHDKTIAAMQDYRPTLGRVSQTPAEKQASAFSKMSANDKAAYLKLIGVDVKAS